MEVWKLRSSKVSENMLIKEESVSWRIGFWWVHVGSRYIQYMIKQELVKRLSGKRLETPKVSIREYVY